VKKIIVGFAKPLSCHTCRMNHLCLPRGLDTNDLDKLEELIERKKPLQPREGVFFSGDPFTSIYAVRSGSIKSFCIDSDGREQVTGFYFPGEVFGWDGLADEHYQNTAIALETTAICEIPYEQLDNLGNSIPSIKKYVMKLISREINADQRLIALLAGNSAQQKLASLLLSISDRLVKQKLSPTRLWLPMSRGEISNYLDLTVETVSRVLGHFQRKQYLKVNKKEIEILDKQALRDLMHSTEDVE
jgi:CRP/FNR family transcriptional regulator